ncbi:MAG: cytochrome C oxidase subunit II, partial [Treponema sp.]|nr:cytochrome C oxidase subunit II [Treponema sp.]
FQDAAFASFSRRRSTVREDINQSFGATSDEEAPAASPASAYLDLINSGEGAGSAPAASEKPRAIAAPKRGRAKAGVVDAKPGRRGKKTGGRTRRGGDALREV